MFPQRIAIVMKGRNDVRLWLTLLPDISTIIELQAAFEGPVDPKVYSIRFFACFWAHGITVIQTVGAVILH